MKATQKESQIALLLPQLQSMTKREVVRLAAKLAADETDPVRSYATLKRLGELCTEGLKNLATAVLESMEDGAAIFEGMQMTAQARGKYSYDHAPMWQEIAEEIEVMKARHKDELAALDAKRKNIETLMERALLKPLETVLNADGEVVPPAELKEKPSFSIVCKY